jgi:hypothetical protein
VIGNEAEYPKDLLLEQFQLLFDAENIQIKTFCDMMEKDIN